jgi:hypothetical protein
VGADGVRVVRLRLTARRRGSSLCLRPSPLSCGRVVPPFIGSGGGSKDNNWAPSGPQAPLRFLRLTSISSPRAVPPV